ncbi:MAG: hypothetical protein ABRQ25_09305 [Clostridiaceae bacterium]
MSKSRSNDLCELCSSVEATANVANFGVKLLTVTATVENVCPGKQVAVAVIVCEGSRILAFKGFVTRCASDKPCRITRDIVFVIPEEVELSDLRVRIIANYIYPPCSGVCS